MKKIIFLLITLVIGCSSMRHKDPERTPSSYQPDEERGVETGNYDRLNSRP